MGPCLDPGRTPKMTGPEAVCRTGFPSASASWIRQQPSGRRGARLVRERVRRYLCTELTVAQGYTARSIVRSWLSGPRPSDQKCRRLSPFATWEASDSVTDKPRYEYEAPVRTYR